MGRRQHSGELARIDLRVSLDLSDVMHGNGILTRASSAPRKTTRFVQFQIGEKARATLLD